MKRIGITCLAILAVILSQAQPKNTVTEIKDYREVDGKIILPMIVNGVAADFILDLAGHTAILPEYTDKLKIDTTQEGTFRSYSTHQYKQVTTSKIVTIHNLSFGNNAYANELPAFVLKDGAYLRQLGVAGIVNGSIFANIVVTLDAQRKKITTTAPYRPPYMKLNNRTEFQIGLGAAPIFSCRVNEQPMSLIFDTWYTGGLALTPEDMKKIPVRSHIIQTISRGYKQNETTDKATTAKVSFIHTEYKDMPVAENPALLKSVLGTALLSKGPISLDYPKRRVYFQSYEETEIKDELLTTPAIKIVEGELNPITRDYFLQQIYDYKQEKEFVYKGNKPMVIDFWASWCGPCMRLLPQLTQLAKKYKGQIIFCKVNADTERELCNIFNIQALPTLFFIPIGGKPIIEVGATFEKYVEIIEKELLKTKSK